MRHPVLHALALLGLAACSSPSAPEASPSPPPSPPATLAEATDAGANDGGDLDGAVGAEATSSLAPVIEIQGAPMVVLAERTDPSWGVGLATSLMSEADEDEDALLATRAVDPSRLPADVRRRATLGYRLVGTSSECHAHLGTPILVRRSNGAMLFLDDEAGEPAPFEDPRSLVARLWPTGREVLAAPVVIESGECGGARFATPEAMPPVRTYRPVEIDDALASSARAAFEDLTAYQALQVEYEEYLRTDPGERDGAIWPSYGGEDSTFVGLFRAEDGRELVVVSAHGEEYCGGFGGSLFALFERGEEGLRLLDSGPMAGGPTMVVDLAEGQRAYLGFEAWRLPSEHDESGYPIWHDVSAPWLGCNC